MSKNSALEEYKKTKDINVRNKILSENLDFIKEQAGRLCLNYKYKNDFEQEAVIGFLEALDRYKEGGNFKACAVWGIRRRILEFYRDSKLIFKTKNKYNIYIASVRKKISNFTQKFKRPPEEGEVLQLLTQKEKGVYELSNNQREEIGSLENSINYMVDEPSIREKTEEKTLHHETLNEILNSLSLEESSLIKQRYGIDCDKKNLKEIGFFLQKTPQRIEQAQKKIEDKIRKRFFKKIS